MQIVRRVWVVEEFLRKVSLIRAKWDTADGGDNGAEWFPWFRGEANADWPTRLRPRLYRRNVRTRTHVTDLLYADQELRLGFRRHVALLLPGRKLDEWEDYFLMQAYGAPTRLLDWTDGALAALYFAIQSRVGERDPEGEADAAVYMLDPWWLNAKTFSKGRRPHDEGVALSDWQNAKAYLALDEFDSTSLRPKIPLAIDPTHIASRMTAQRAHFTIFGREVDGLITCCRRNDSRLVKIPIARKAILPIYRQLKLSGVSELTLFPDLEGLGRELSHLWEDLVRGIR